MRTSTVAIAALLALLPLVGALPSPGPATVQASDTGYMPPVLAIPSGTQVSWIALDHTHVTSESLLLSGDPCFGSLDDPARPDGPVRFILDDLLQDAVLYAEKNGELRACSSAVATVGGAALAYHCLLHPTMRGTIEVTIR